MSVTFFKNVSGSTSIPHNLIIQGKIINAGYTNSLNNITESISSLNDYTTKEVNAINDEIGVINSDITDIGTSITAIQNSPIFNSNVKINTGDLQFINSVKSTTTVLASIALAKTSLNIDIENLNALKIQNNGVYLASVNNKGILNCTDVITSEGSYNDYLTQMNINIVQCSVDNLKSQAYTAQNTLDISGFNAKIKTLSDNITSLQASVTYILNKLNLVVPVNNGLIQGGA